MSILSSIFKYMEARGMKLIFAAWLVSKFVPKNKRWAVSQFITYYPYAYLTRKRVKSLTGGKVKDIGCGGITSVSGSTYTGEHVSFNGMIIQGGGKVIIGNWFHSGEGCRIITQNHNYKGNAIPYDETMIVKDVKIGDFVWLGTNVLILPGTQIGEGAIIQAGSVVHGEIPPLAIAGGNPCRVFKYRDKEHFEKLKAEGRFL